LYVFASWVLDPFLEFFKNTFNQTIMNMKKYLLLFTALLFSACFAMGQVAQYTFQQSTGTYVDLGSSGTVIATPTANTLAGSVDDVVFNLPNGSFPFSFVFDGIGYTGCNISSNGFITFGSTAPGGGTYGPLSATLAYAGAISPWGSDANGMFQVNGVTSELSWAVVGTAPNREVVIQWKNWRPAYTTSITLAPYINYQVRLAETTNLVKIVYGPSGLAAGTANTTRTPQIGLRGPNNTFATNVLNRTNPTTVLFINSVPGTTNSSTQSYSSVTATPGGPTNGLTYTYTPPTPASCGVPSSLAANAVTANGATLNWAPPAPAPSSGYQWEVRTSGAAGSGATGLAASGSTAAGVTTANISGLTPGTSYTAFVRSNCGNDDFSNWTAGTGFQTTCLPASLPFSENFNASTFPACWSQSFSGGVTTNRWTVNNSNAAGGQPYEMVAQYASGTGITRLISPVINLSGVAAARLSFKHFYDDYGTGVTIKVQSSSDLTNWVDESFSIASGSGDASGDVSVNLTTLSPTTYIAWVIDGDHYQFDFWYVDNVSVRLIPAIDLSFESFVQLNGFNPPLLNPAGNQQQSEKPVKGNLTLDINAQGEPTSAVGTTELYKDNGVQSPNRSFNAIDLGASIKNVGLNAASYSLNWMVNGIAQTPYAGSSIAPDAGENIVLAYSPTERGTFLASGTLNVTGDGFTDNNSNQARVRVYPNQFARTTYDNGTNVPTTFVGFNDLTTPIIVAVRFTTPNNFAKLAGVDFFARTENATSGTFTVEVRAAGTTTTAPGPVFYTKTYSNNAFFASNGDILHFAFDDDFPSLGPNSDYWITISTPLGILFPAGAQAMTTGRSFFSSTGLTWTALALSGTNYAWMMRSVHVEGTPHPPCPVPVQPTTLALTPQTTSIGGTFVSAVGTTGHIVVRTSIPALSEAPQNGSVYNTTTNSTIGNGTVVFVSTATTTFSNTGLTHGTTYYYHVFPFNTGLFCSGPTYNSTSPLTGSATTFPAAPATFTALPLGPNQIGFTATANSLGHNIMIAWSTESTTAFGTPIAMYPIGSTIPGGGVVHYVGPANEVYNHNNLSENTTYYYRAWTIVPGPIYSSTSLLSTVKTPCSPYTQLPWYEGFEGVDLGASSSSTTLFPTCWTKQNGDWATANNSSSTYDADARSGVQFLRNSWSATNEFMWTPGFALQSGTSYDFSFWWAGDNYAGWTGDVFYNSTPNGAGATQLGASFVTPLTVTSKTYIKVTQSFIPEESGTYYFAIRINATSAPWYLSFDDFELRVTPTAPIFVVSPQQADFGSQSILMPSVPQVFTFYNDGIGTISVNSIAIEGANADQFILNQNEALPILLGPNEAGTVSVTFAPSAVGPKTAQLVITDDLNNRAVHSLPLTGIGVDPTITSFPYVESFDEPTFAPTGWTNTRTAGTGTPGIWERTTAGVSPEAAPKSGAAMAQFRSFNFSAGTKAELITPPINFPEGNFRVSFWMYRDAGYPDNTDLVNVYFNTTNSLEDAMLLGTVNRSMTLEPVVLTQGWHAYSYFLPEEATGNGRYIILEAISAYGNNIFIDDFSIGSPMVVTHTATNLSCFESNDGSIALNIEGGIPPLTIIWKKDDVLLESTNPVLEQLSAAVYEYTVREATGNAVTEIVTLTQPAAIPVATATNTTFVYDGTVKTINAVAPAGTTLVWYAQAVGGEAVAAPAKSDAGVYNYWVAAKSNTSDCQSPRVGVVLTINKKALTVKADDKSKCQNTDLPLLTITYTGFVANEGVAQLTELPIVTTTALPNSPIGTYPITVSGGISNNYSFVYQSGTLTVVRTPMVFAGGPGFVCVSEVFPIVAATATNFTTLVWSTSGNGTFSNAGILNPVYTPGSMDIANGSVVLTLTADPGSYCSGIDQMVLSIQNDLPVSVTITQDDTEICIGELVTFNAVPVNGGLSPVFQWKVNGQNAGSNSSIFTYLPSNGDVVTVIVTTSISCALNTTATSNAITVNVTSDLIAGVMVSTTSNAVCDFTPTNFFATPVNGGTNPTYQWKVNGENAGTNAPQFTYIPLNGDEVSVVMTSSHSCAVVPVAISNVITMSVAPPFLELAANPTKGGTVSGGGNYPDGTEVTITATAAAGWEFLNWRNADGSILSTEAVVTFTINKCYEKLTATFSSTAKIVGQLKYFNENESVIPSPNNRGVFYVQIFENGQALSPRQVVAHNLELGLDSYYEFTGVESGKDYSIRIWEEATNNTLGNTWSFNNWGGATSADAFIISWMANMDPQLTAFPWIWPAGATALTPYSEKVADVNNNQMIANSDALMVLYRLLDLPEFSPFPGGAHNFSLATTKIEDHQHKAHPVAPEKLFTQHGGYLAGASAPSVYQEVLLTNLSDGTNIYNIYFLATGDLNTSYTPGGSSKQLAMLEYNGVINTIKGDEIMIPVRISQAADLGAITLGFSYNNDVIEVLDVIGYDLHNIDHENGTVKIAWYDHQSKSFASDQHLVILKARLKGELSTGTRYLELLPFTELADANAMQLQNVTLRTDYIETAAGIKSNPELLSINHSIFPNPFNDYTNIQYTLPNAGKVQIVVFNHLGQEVIRILDETQTAGSHQIRLNNYELNGAGTYFYQIRLDNEGQSISARGTLLMMK
jgi:hypothetical protein